MSLLGVAVLFVTSACFQSNLPADSDLPRSQRVDNWTQAARLARSETFEPTRPAGADGGPELTVKGVPGDSTRPLAAEYPGGLLVRQAHVDVDPQLEDEPARVSGADDAWWGAVQGERYLYVRRDETLVILSGRPEDDLIRTANSLRPVEVPDG